MFRAESARIGIGETIAVGRILYASDVPLIVLDETWILAREAVIAYTIMSFGEIDVYIGFAEPAPPTPAVMIEAEEISGSPCPWRWQSSGSQKTLIPPSSHQLRR